VVDNDLGVAAEQTRTTILRTSRLVVTTWLVSDVAELLRLHADPSVMRYMTTGVQDRAQTLDRIRTWMGEQRSRGWSKWRVVDVAGRFVGRSGFSRAHGSDHREVGYLLAPECWGSGYATELLEGLVRWHFENPDPTLRPDLLAYVLGDNLPSRRVLEKNGFSPATNGSPPASELVYRITEPKRPPAR
jgi:RimJ/RimL family protein N-acetyltransferase